MPDMEVPKPPTTKEDSDARGVYNDFMKAGDRLNAQAEQTAAQRAAYDKVQQNLKGPEKSAWQKKMDAISTKWADLKKRTMDTLAGRKDELLSMIDDPAFDVPKTFSDQDNEFFAKGDAMNAEAAQRAQYDSMQKKLKAHENRNTKPVSELKKNDPFREMATDPKWDAAPASDEQSKDEDKAAA